jgi:hypothetical protein
MREIVKESKSQRVKAEGSILNTADRKAVRLVICVPVHRCVAGVQVTVPRIISALNRRPDVREGSTIVERTVGIATAS